MFTTEVWACNLRIGLGDPQTSAVSLESIDTWTRENVVDVATDVATWFEDGDALISAAARLDYVKLNAIDGNGRYFSQADTVQVEYGAADAPQGGTTAGDPQQSAVVSLLTDATRGRGSRGRFYPPTGQLTVDGASGRVSATLTERMAGAALDLLNNLANEPGVDLSSPRVIVASDLGQPGPARSVTSVAVGNVIDVQRRRRNALPEAYSSAGPVTIV